MGLSTRVADRDDLDAVTETIATAFLDDPTWSWAFPDDERRLEQYRRWWRPAVAAAIPQGGVRVADGAAAASVWIPPGGEELLPADEAGLARLAADLVGDRAATLLEVVDLFDQHHPRAVPHHYLSLFGTHPDYRGQGIGMALLADDLATIDATGAAAYLESSNPANVHRYERVGFVVTGSFRMPGDGPTITTMWREPRSVA